MYGILEKKGQMFGKLQEVDLSVNDEIKNEFVKKTVGENINFEISGNAQELVAQRRATNPNQFDSQIHGASILYI